MYVCISFICCQYFFFEIEEKESIVHLYLTLVQNIIFLKYRFVYLTTIFMKKKRVRDTV